MNILAAFFLIGLLCQAIKIFVQHLWISLDRFNETEKFLINTTETDSANLLSVVSHDSVRRDSNYIRVTSTRSSNDRMKRLAYPAVEKSGGEYKIPVTA